MRKMIHYRLPVAFWLLGARFILSALYGFGAPLGQLIEGEFGYLNIVVVILAGVMFLRVYEASGAIALLMGRLSRLMDRRPMTFLFIVMALLYVPGMFTGLGVPAVLIVGGLAFPLLTKMGFSPERAAAFISLGAMYGSVTGPLNIPVMIIACAINMPYEGFGLVLPAITVPLGGVTALALGWKTARGFVPAAAEAQKGERVFTPTVVLPVLVLLLLVGLPRLLPRYVPDFGTPLAFFAAMLCVFLCVAVLGMKRGTVAVVLYLLIGFAGLPVFAGFSGGPGAIFRPAGGFLVGFVPLALLSGWTVDRYPHSVLAQFAGMFAGLVVLYVFGTTWLIWITKLPLEKALRAAVYPFVALDSAKAAVAILFGRVLKKRLALLR